MTEGRPNADEAIRYAGAVRGDPAAAVRRWKVLSGGKAVGCFPLYVPEEVLCAAGMLPVTLWGDEFPDAPPAGTPPFLCGVVRGALGSLRGGRWDAIDAWAAPSTCDSIQNAAEVLKAGGESRPLFPLVFPLSGDLPGASEYLLDRIEAFAGWAEGVSGRPVSEGALQKAIASCNENRRTFARLEDRMAESPGSVTAVEFALLARAGSLLPKETHSGMLRAVAGRRRSGGRSARARVFLAGMMATDAVASALDRAGAAVVGNDLGRGHRCYGGLAEEGGDAAIALVRRHFSRETCSTLHWGGDARLDSLFRRAAACGADRLLLLRLRQCELEAGDETGIAARARELGIPFLAADADPAGPGAPGSLAVRVEAFVEAGE